MSARTEQLILEKARWTEERAALTDQVARLEAECHRLRTYIARIEREGVTVIEPPLDEEKPRERPENKREG